MKFITAFIFIISAQFAYLQGADADVTPETHNISMILFTSKIPYGKNIRVNIACDDFDRSNPVVFLVHGFISDANYSENYQLTSELIKQNYNVFALDWSYSAFTYYIFKKTIENYLVASRNTHEIGHLMANYVISLMEQCKIPLRNIIFIGHSLGAHVSAFAAKQIKASGHSTVPLLIGADPAGPNFEINPCEDRLCNTDADRVIVIHTSGLGIQYSMGDIDLFFNGGYSQPRCWTLSCAHARSVEYITEVMKYPTCVFPGIPKTHKYSYPDSQTTDCVVFNSKILSNKSIPNGSYYMFVNRKSHKHCTEKKFNCK